MPQIAILIGAICVYFGVRGATEGSVSQALANAQQVVDFERFLGIYHEPWLQETFAGSEAVKTFFNWIYIWGHWPVIAVTLIWLARRHPAIYLRTRNAMMLSGGIGMIIFAAFPVAPPRLAELGMIDTVTVSSHAYRVLQPPMFTNQYAAVPSLHVGWDLLIGIAIAVAARRLWVRVIGVIMPVAMTAAVVLTANHYLVDAVAGAALTTAAWFACGWWLRRRSPSPTVLSAGSRATPAPAWLSFGSPAAPALAVPAPARDTAPSVDAAPAERVWDVALAASAAPSVDVGPAERTWDVALAGSAATAVPPRGAMPVGGAIPEGDAVPVGGAMPAGDPPPLPLSVSAVLAVPAQSGSRTPAARRSRAHARGSISISGAFALDQRESP